MKVRCIEYSAIRYGFTKGEVYDVRDKDILSYTLVDNSGHIRFNIPKRFFSEVPKSRYSNNTSKLSIEYEETVRPIKSIVINTKYNNKINVCFNKSNSDIIMETEGSISKTYMQLNHNDVANLIEALSKIKEQMVEKSGVPAETFNCDRLVCGSISTDRINISADTIKAGTINVSELTKELFKSNTFGF